MSEFLTAKATFSLFKATLCALLCGAMWTGFGLLVALAWLVYFSDFVGFGGGASPL